MASPPVTGGQAGGGGGAGGGGRGGGVLQRHKEFMLPQSRTLANGVCVQLWLHMGKAWATPSHKGTWSMGCKLGLRCPQNLSSDDCPICQRVLQNNLLTPFVSVFFFKVNLDTKVLK